MLVVVIFYLFLLFYLGEPRLHEASLKCTHFMAIGLAVFLLDENRSTETKLHYMTDYQLYWVGQNKPHREVP